MIGRHIFSNSEYSAVKPIFTDSAVQSKLLNNDEILDYEILLDSILIWIRTLDPFQE